MKTSIIKSTRAIFNCSMIVVLMFSSLAMSTVKSDAIEGPPISPREADQLDIGDFSSSCSQTLFSDDFSTSKGWVDESGGTVVRNTTTHELDWDARRDTPLHYYYPISANSGFIQLDLRFKVLDNSGNGMMWFGLAESLTSVLPNVAAADRPGIFFSPDTNKKIQLISTL